MHSLLIKLMIVSCTLILLHDCDYHEYCHSYHFNNYFNNRIQYQFYVHCSQNYNQHYCYHRNKYHYYSEFPVSSPWQCIVLDRVGGSSATPAWQCALVLRNIQFPLGNVSGNPNSEVNLFREQIILFSDSCKERDGKGSFDTPYFIQEPYDK